MQVNSVNQNYNNQNFGMAVGKVSKRLVPTEFKATEKSIKAIEAKYPKLNFKIDAETLPGTKTLREFIVTAEKHKAGGIRRKLANLFGLTLKTKSAGPNAATHRIPLVGDVIPSAEDVSKAQEALMKNVDIAAESYTKKVDLIKNTRAQETIEAKELFNATNSKACLKNIKAAKKEARRENKAAIKAAKAEAKNK